MATIAVVNVGNYRGMGARYVNALYRGCERNSTLPFRFACLTDDDSGLLPQIEPKQIPTGLTGWYNKLAVFRPGMFPQGERVVFFDLDVIILSNIDALLRYNGEFAILQNPHPDMSHYVNSSVMAWEAGDCDDIWKSWVKADVQSWLGGDQGWINDQKPNAPRLQSIFPGCIRSFIWECAKCGPERPKWRFRWRLRFAKHGQVPYPDGAAIIYFHGEPKPDNCRSRWIRQAWR